MSHTNPVDKVPMRTGEPRQLLFLALCSLALVVAAFAAPPTAQGSSPPDLPLGELFGNQSEQAEECTVLLSENPVPGRDVTVTVRRDGEPVEDVRVWFNDRPIGVTDRSGTVDGRVPYVRNLEVTVDLPGGGSCEFTTGTNYAIGNGPSAAHAGETDSAAERTTDPGTERTNVADASIAGASVATVDVGRTAPQVADPVNVSDTYTVAGGISLDVVGAADPGETVTLVATIEDRPVPGAAVTVDGQRVGKTDGDGEYVLRIPDDGTEALNVRVQRGEIQGRTRVDVRLLTVSVRGTQFPLPGQSATVGTAIEGEPVENATVTLGGERVGTTDALGRTEITLPANPLATVTATAGDRSARQSMLAVFAPTIAAVAGVLLLVFGVPLAFYWAGGRRALAGLLGLAANLITGAAGYAVAGRDGALFAVGSTVLLFALVLFLRHPRLATGAGESTGRLLGSLGDRVTNGVLAITRGVEILLNQALSSVRRALAALRRFDLASLAAGVRAWVVAVPGRLLAAAKYAVYAPGRLVEWIRSGFASDEDGDDDATASEPASAARAPGPAIRELWRDFARRVVPERWPQRTPGEVSRRAVDAGFPRESVAELTTVFRDVEYGGESLSDERYRRARAAFDALGVSDGAASARNVGDESAGTAADGPDTGRQTGTGSETAGRDDDRPDAGTDDPGVDRS